VTAKSCFYNALPGTTCVHPTVKTLAPTDVTFILSNVEQTDPELSMYGYGVLLHLKILNQSDTQYLYNFCRTNRTWFNGSYTFLNQPFSVGAHAEFRCETEGDLGYATPGSVVMNYAWMSDLNPVNFNVCQHKLISPLEFDVTLDDGSFVPTIICGEWERIESNSASILNYPWILLLIAVLI
jgi:hypothetical protein